MPVAIVTGASSGIGEALAVELHRRGWKVGLVARREAQLAALTQSLGEGAAHASADVTDASQTRTAMAQLEQTLGPCDLVVANAGLGINNPAWRLDVDALFQVHRVNFDGAVHTATAVLPGMMERSSGHLAVVSSVAGYRGLPRAGPYSASKAAVSTLFESWRVVLKRNGIAVTCIHPGFIETPMTAQNKHPMPFMMKADRAARIIADGLEKRRSDITFPWQMRWLMRCVRWLPNWLFDRVVSRAV
jgi:short-subunit dehydrogenase